MNSVWKEFGKRIRFGSLQNDITTDVLIIGGGISGILCAYKLKRAGIDCIIAEANEICSGITKNTTAKITLCHGLIYDKIIKKYGEENARLYLEAQLNALGEYSRICAQIDCDYEKKDSFIYTLSDEKKIELEINALKKLGYSAKFSDIKELPFAVNGAVQFRDQAQFHPLKFLYGISKELSVYENTKIVELKPNIAVTNNGKISFKRLIVATHFPILNKHGAFFLKMYQHRSYVLALKGTESIDGMYVDESATGLSFRSYNDLLLLGGGGHRTGKKGGAFKELEEVAKKYYKSATVVKKWATQDCITLDGIPYIGLYSKNIPDVYVATGFNKWGMTNALVAANILADMLQGRNSPYEKFFSPCRSILHPQLAVNVFESTKGLLRPTAPRCPHLGCALIYNEAEHSWDCPCHGSRFTEEGELIDNPATDDKTAIRK